MDRLLLRGRVQQPANRARQPVPPIGLDGELPPALGGQPVELCPTIVLWGAILERDPAALDEAMDRLLLRGRVQQPANRARQPVPPIGLDGELPPALGGQPVELCPTIVL